MDSVLMNNQKSKINKLKMIDKYVGIIINYLIVVW